MLFRSILNKILAILSPTKLHVTRLPGSTNFSKYVKMRIAEGNKKLYIANLQSIFMNNREQQVKMFELNKHIDSIVKKYGIDTVAVYQLDAKGEVDFNSIEIIGGDQVDQKTIEILKAHGGHLILDPVN